ncbi:MAG: hypothetical protein QXE50_08095 [Nitrososphaerota archaeon]
MSTQTLITVLLVVTTLALLIVLFGQDRVEQYDGFTVYQRGVILTPGFTLRVEDRGTQVPVKSIARIHIEVHRGTVEEAVWAWLQHAKIPVCFLTAETANGQAGMVALALKRGYQIVTPPMGTFSVQLQSSQRIGEYILYSILGSIEE